MAEMSTEKFAQRAFDVDLIEAQQLEAIWGEFGSRDVPLDEFKNLLVRRELLTNFQIDRLLEGKRDGFFYGPYKLLYLVGAGTFARVYRAVHRDKGRIVAIKVLRQRYVDDLKVTEQFVREAQTVIPLRHPNIVPIFEVSNWRSRPYMVMDFVEGQNLRDFVKVRGKLSIEDSIRVASDIAAGLDYASAKGVYHRDLKLSNVLMASTGRAKLVDFGLAGIAGSGVDEGNNPRSIDYAGLERASGVRKNDSRSDIFFAGCILYQLLSGKPPLVETRDRIQRLSLSRYKEIASLGTIEPDLPNYVIAVVNQALEFDPKRRYQSAGEYLSDLKRISARVAAGDPGAPNEATVSREQEEKDQKRDRLVREGENRRVMIIEADIQRQDFFRENLKKRGYRVLVVSDPSRALQRFENHLSATPLADCVIFATHELGRASLDAFNEFGSNEITAEIPAILLVDKAHGSLAKLAETGPHREAVREPVTIGKLRTLLYKLVKLAEPANPDAE